MKSEPIIMRRWPAEWEPQSGVQFTFPHAGSDWAEMLEAVTPCFVASVEAVSRYEKVLVVCDDVNRVRPLLKHARQDRLILVEQPSNDTWARDHGGIVVLEDNEPVLLDFMFNGWGLKFPADRDNLLTGRLFEAGIFRVKSRRLPGIVLEGGGVETDGRGTLLTTAQCLLSPNRNPHLSQAEIEQTLREWLGVDRFLWLHHGHLAGDDTDAHIDTLARFCDPRTITYVQCTDPEDEHYAALQKMEAELRSFRQVDGAPYRLVPLPMPEAIYAEDGHRLPATYANFLIINGAVLAPVYGVSRDETALSQLRDLFPGREVIPIDCRVLIEQHGSLHCISMQYPEGSIA